MSLNLQDMERRLKALERKVKLATRTKGSRHEVHEITTLPNTGQFSDDDGVAVTPIDLIAVSAANVVYVVPIKLQAPIRVSHVYAVGESSTGASVNFALALYRALVPTIDRASPETTRLQLDLVQELARASVTATFSDTARVEGALARELLLDPGDGHYYIGFSASSTAGRYLSPGAGFPKTARQFAHVGTPTPTALTFPASIVTATTHHPAPLIVLRSALGQFLYEDRDQ